MFEPRTVDFHDVQHVHHISPKQEQLCQIPAPCHESVRFNESMHKETYGKPSAWHEAKLNNVTRAVRLVKENRPVDLAVLLISRISCKYVSLNHLVEDLLF